MAATNLQLPWLTLLNSKKVVLASSSPRRKEILTNLGVNYTVVPSTFPETLDKSLFPHPTDYVKENALQKALEVYHRLKTPSSSTSSSLVPDVIIGADTVVTFGDRILEKPGSIAEAEEMLTTLSSGKFNIVYTGMVILWTDPKTGEMKQLVDVEGSTVEMNDNSQELIKAYVATGEPMDKAGGYGYQGKAAVLVKGIQGCYWNVVGLPAAKLFSNLKIVAEQL